MKKLTEAKRAWKILGDIPVNDSEEIEEFFLHFPIGTHREEIWHWIEEEFNVSVATDLMYLQTTTNKRIKTWKKK